MNKKIKTIIIVVAGIALFGSGMFFGQILAYDYDNPGFVEYKKEVIKCNAFYGGGRIPFDWQIYKNWLKRKPIPC